jgi:PRTRC genetic system protein A
MSALADPRDVAVAAVTPILPMPRHGPLPPLACGAKRLLAAGDGLYLEALTPALDLCWPLAPVPTPYGPLAARLRTHSPIDRHLLATVLQAAKATPEREIAAAICRRADGRGHEIVWPPIQSSGAGHVTYRDEIDDDRLVLDIHSHGRGAAFFSRQDDTSDLSRRGPYLAAVIGRCDRAEAEITFRLVCAPYLIPLDVADLIQHGVFA